MKDTIVCWCWLQLLIQLSSVFKFADDYFWLILSHAHHGVRLVGTKDDFRVVLMLLLRRFDMELLLLLMFEVFFFLFSCYIVILLSSLFTLPYSGLEVCQLVVSSWCSFSCSCCLLLWFLMLLFVWCIGLVSIVDASCCVFCVVVATMLLVLASCWLLLLHDVMRQLVSWSVR